MKKLLLLMLVLAVLTGWHTTGFAAEEKQAAVIPGAAQDSAPGTEQVELISACHDLRKTIEDIATSQKDSHSLQELRNDADSSIEKIKKLLDNGANPNAEIRIKGRDACPLLTVFADTDRHGKEYVEYNVRIIKALVDAGANVNAIDKNGCTALCSAIYHENTQIVKTLIQAKANVNLGDKDGPPLCQAVLRENVEITKALVAAGANVAVVSPSCAKNSDMRSLLETLTQQQADMQKKGLASDDSIIGTGERTPPRAKFAEESDKDKPTEELLSRASNLTLSEYENQKKERKAIFEEAAEKGKSILERQVAAAAAKMQAETKKEAVKEHERQQKSKPLQRFKTFLSHNKLNVCLGLTAAEIFEIIYLYTEYLKEAEDTKDFFSWLFEKNTKLDAKVLTTEVFMVLELFFGAYVCHL